MSTLRDTQITDWFVEDVEYGKVVTPGQSSAGGPLPLWIPKFCPTLGIDEKTHKTTVSDGCFVNDTSIKPSITKQITTQSFKTVSFLPERGLKHAVVEQGATVRIIVDNRDPDKINATNYLDPSHD